jgi:hypothetical protein
MLGQIEILLFMRYVIYNIEAARHIKLLSEIVYIITWDYSGFGQPNKFRIQPEPDLQHN